MRDHPEVNDYVTRLRLDRPRDVTSIRVQPVLIEGQLIVRGASLIDERTGGFQSLVISGRGHFRLVQSGDVKIYENLGALPRAFVVPQAVSVPNDAEALTVMRAASFDPAQTVVLASDGQPLRVSGWTNPIRLSDCIRCSKTDVMSYAPEHIVIETENAEAGWLVLTDAWYPGWRAAVDGAPIEIARADVIFRAVPIPAGRHRVEFVFAPRSVWAGAGISLATVVGCLITFLLVKRPT